jgi:hypothetical protein
MYYNKVLAISFRMSWASICSEALTGLLLSFCEVKLQISGASICSEALTGLLLFCVQLSFRYLLGFNMQ